MLGDADCVAVHKVYPSDIMAEDFADLVSLLLGAVLSLNTGLLSKIDVPTSHIDRKRCENRVQVKKYSLEVSRAT